MFVVGAEDGNTDSILPVCRDARAVAAIESRNLASRPFDVGRMVLSAPEAGAVLVLESEEESGAAVPGLQRVVGWGRLRTDITSRFPILKVRA